MKELFVYAAKASFEALLAAGDIDNTQIGIIPDSAEIWVNGEYLPLVELGNYVTSDQMQTVIYSETKAGFEEQIAAGEVTINNVGIIAETAEFWENGNYHPLADLSGYVTKETADSVYLKLSGGTLTGQVKTRELLPSANLSYNLGSSAYKYNDVFANRLRCNLLTDSGTANGSYSKVLGLYAYAGVRTGNSTYPFAYLEKFPTQAFTVNGETVYGYILAPNETLTYTYNSVERTVTNPNATYCSVFAIINGGDDFCGTTTAPLRKATVLEMVGFAYSYFTQIEVIEDGVQGVVLYSWSKSLTHSFSSAKNILAFKRSASSDYSGNYSVASGVNSVASGYSSVASGANSVASGAYSVASGNSSVASGASSVASGANSVASGASSVASGANSVASHDSAKVFATHGKSGRSQQTALGYYNEGKSTTALEVGWGSGDSARKNIFEVDTSGNVASTGTNTATKHITKGGTSSQFVKGDGSLDGKTYLYTDAQSLTDAQKKQVADNLGGNTTNGLARYAGGVLPVQKISAPDANGLEQTYVLPNASDDVKASATGGVLATEDTIMKFSNDLTGRIEATPETFTFRPSAGDKSIRDESAVMRSIKGNTIVWNQLAYETKVYNHGGITYTFGENDVVTANGTLTGESSRFGWVPLQENHYYYHRVEVIDMGECSEIWVGNVNEYYGRKIFNSPKIYERIVKRSNTLNTIIGIIRTSDTDINVTGLTVGYQCFDLTQMFGAGNEPTTVEEFRALFPDSYYPYCEPELRSVTTKAIETVGFNQFNGKYAEVLPNNAYYLGGTYTTIGFTEEIGGTTEDITIPDNKLYTPTKKGYIYATGTNICINLSHSGVRNGEYQPYEKHTRELPEIAKYFPNGMRSAGSIYDEIRYNDATEQWEAVQRVGVRAYTSADDGDVAVITDGTNSNYELAEPIITPIEEPIQMDYWVEDFGTEEAISDTPSAPFKADVVYQFNAEGRIRDNSRNIERLEDIANDIKEDINNVKSTYATKEELYNSNLWYGIEWDTTISTPACTRIGDMNLHRTLPIQSNMKGCLLDDNGNVVTYLDDWLNATRDGSMGQVMVEIPMHYRKFEEEGTVRRCKISTGALPGFHLVPRMYVSAYEATVERSTTKLCSVVNMGTNYRGGNNNSAWDGTYRTLLGRPATAISLTNFRNYARKRNTNTTEWNCNDYNAYKAVFWLYYVEYANRNCQLAFNAAKDTNGFSQGGLGNGVTTMSDANWSTYFSYYPFVPCGHTDELGNGSGEVAYEVPSDDGSVLATVYANRYRGVENPFGHIWKWTDGINIKISPTEKNGGDGTSKVYVADDPANYNDSNYDGYSMRGLEARDNGYVKELIFGEFGDIMPAAVGGGSTTYYADYHYTNIPTAEALRGVLFGGLAPYGVSSGFGCALSNCAPSYTAAYIGSRLCFIPRQRI